MDSVILEARELTKEYRNAIALDHIDLQIKKGKIYGFIGQNGAGKTTFLRLCYLSSKYAHFLWNKNVQIIRSS